MWKNVKLAMGSGTNFPPYITMTNHPNKSPSSQYFKSPQYFNKSLTEERRIKWPACWKNESRGLFIAAQVDGGLEGGSAIGSVICKDCD